MGRDILDPRGAVGTQFPIDPLTGLPASGSAAGVAGNVQFNTAGMLAADPLFNWITGTSTLRVGDPLVRTSELFVSGVTGPGLRLHALVGSSGFGPVINLQNDAVGATKSSSLLFTNDAPATADITFTSSTAVQPGNAGANMLQIAATTPNVNGIHVRLAGGGFRVWLGPDFAAANEVCAIDNFGIRLFGNGGTARLLQLEQAASTARVVLKAPDAGVTTHFMVFPATGPGAVQNAIIEVSPAGVQTYKNFQTGTAKLALGTVTVAVATVTAASVIGAWHKDTIGACGVLVTNNRVVGNPGSFDIVAFDTTGAALVADVSNVDWIVED